MTTSWNLKSMLRAASLSLAIAFGMTAGQAIVYPDTAQAGIVGGLKNAAKKVGSGVKKAAITVGSGVKGATVAAGKLAAKTPPVKGVISAGKAIRAHAKRI
jgi:hypothetical protein